MKILQINSSARVEGANSTRLANTVTARLQAKNHNLLLKDPPFYIPEFELKMAWCPLLHHHPAHRWLRQLILYVARQMIEEENREFMQNNSQFSPY